MIDRLFQTVSSLLALLLVAWQTRAAGTSCMDTLAADMMNCYRVLPESLRNLSDPRKLFGPLKSNSRLIEKICKESDSISSCEEEVISSCSPAQKRVDAMGLSLRNTAKIYKRVCNNIAEFMRGLTCLFMYDNFVKTLQKCFSKYLNLLSHQDDETNKISHEEHYMNVCLFFTNGSDCVSTEIRKLCSDTFTELIEKALYDLRSEECKNPLIYLAEKYRRNNSGRRDASLLLLLSFLLLQRGYL